MLCRESCMGRPCGIDGGPPVTEIDQGMCVAHCLDVPEPGNEKCLGYFAAALQCQRTKNVACSEGPHACQTEWCASLMCDTCQGCDFTCQGGSCTVGGVRRLICD